MREGLARALRWSAGDREAEAFNLEGQNFQEARPAVSIEDITIVSIDKFEFPFHALDGVGFHVAVPVSGIGTSELAREGMPSPCFGKGVA